MNADKQLRRNGLILALWTILILFGLWVYFLGFLGVDQLSGSVIIVYVGLPIASIWLIFSVIARYQAAKLWHVVALIAYTVLMILFLIQPWSTRSQFRARLGSIRPGMTESQARLIMGGYSVEEKRPFDFDSDDPRILSATHELRFARGDPDLDGASGAVFVKGNTVIKAEFLPGFD